MQNPERTANAPREADQLAYVLGTHDDELQRLGLQHRVWRPRVLEAWAEAGITDGSRVVDLGCGPGFATLDLAEVVGPTGAVLAIERSPRFVQFARTECERRGYWNVRILEADLTAPIDIPGDFDAVWCRWVAAFVGDLAPLLRLIRVALRPGGMVIFHEYVDYSTWRAIPRSPQIESFVAEVIASWRASGGEPDIARSLVPQLSASGFEIAQTKPIIFAVEPGTFGWRWPSSFIRSHVPRLVEIGRVNELWARGVLEELDRLEGAPETRMLTPLVLQITARKAAK